METNNTLTNAGITGFTNQEHINDAVNNFFKSIYKYFSQIQLTHKLTIDKLIEVYWDKKDESPKELLDLSQFLFTPKPKNLIHNFDNNLYNHTKFSNIQKLWNINKDRLKRSDNLNIIINYPEKIQIIVIMYETLYKNAYLLINSTNYYMLSFNKTEDEYLNDIWKCASSLMLFNMALYRLQIEINSVLYDYDKLFDMFYNYITVLNDIYNGQNIDFNKINKLNHITYRYLLKFANPAKINCYFNEKMNIDFDLVKLNNDMTQFRNSVNELDREYLSFYFKFYNDFMLHYLNLDYTTNKKIMNKIIQFKDNFHKSINLFKEEEEFMSLVGNFIRI